MSATKKDRNSSSTSDSTAPTTSGKKKSNALSSSASAAAASSSSRPAAASSSRHSAAAPAASVDDIEEGDADDDDSSGTFVRDPEEYRRWMESLPVLYDCFLHSNIEWPAYSLAWGPVLPEPGTAGASAAASSSAAAAAAAAAASASSMPHLTSAALDPQLYNTSYVNQTLFFSRSTDAKIEKDRWVGSPNMLLKAEIYYPNQYRVQDISKMQNFDEDQRNPALIIKKKIVHPGEINRIKVVPQYPDLIATHTDSPLVYVWDTNSQVSRRSQPNTEPSLPDLTLQGHKERADTNSLYYALDCSKHAPLIISGGSDRKICLWNIQDYCSSLSTTSESLSKSKHKPIERMLSPRIIFSGHTAQVEEVCFHPNTSDLLCSVGDDRMLMVWDVRAGGSAPVVRIHTTHKEDVNAVHWNPVNDNLLVTGASDHSIKLIDLRRVSKSSSFEQSYRSSDKSDVIRSHTSNAKASPSVVETFLGHKGNVTNVQWHSNGNYFASGSDDGDVCIWTIKNIPALHQYQPAAAAASASSSLMSDSDIQSSPPLTCDLPSQLIDGSADGQPSHLLFRHCGHRTAVVNFAWNPYVKDGWTIASLSDDSADESLVGGGRLHIWRITDLLTAPYHKIAEEFAGQSTQWQPSASPSPILETAAAMTTVQQETTTTVTKTTLTTTTTTIMKTEVRDATPDEDKMQLED